MEKPKQSISRMSKKYIDELCKLYNNGDVKELAYYVYECGRSKLNFCNAKIDMNWMLYEICSTLKPTEVDYVMGFLESGNQEQINFFIGLLNCPFNFGEEIKENIKECINQEENYKYQTKTLVSLVQCTKDALYIEKYIDKNSQSKLSSEEIYELILSTKILNITWIV